MDKSWQKNLLAFLGLIAAIFSVFAFFKPATGPESHEIPQSLEIRLENLERKIEQGKSEILNEMSVRRSARDREIGTMNSNFNEKLLVIMQGINRLDDRLFQMQQKKSAKVFSSNLGGS